MKIELKHVCKVFKKIEVIKDINLTLESGKIYGLYGRNGSGKSVLLKMISGFYIPTSGEILYDGVNLNTKLEFPKDLRALIEGPSFFPDLSGYENLKMLAKIQHKIGEEEIIEALANNIPVLSSNLSSKTDAVYCGGLTLPISKECLADPYLVPSDNDVEEWLVSLEKFELNYNKVAHLCQKSLKHFKLEDNVKNAAELLSVLCKK